MINGFDGIQNIGRQNADVALRSIEAVGEGFQAIAAEAADYSKRSVEAGASAVEKLIAAKSLGKAVEIQADFARSVFAGSVDQVTKVGDIVSDMMAGAAKPYEAFFGKLGR